MYAARTMTWLVMLLVAATPVVSYGVACVDDGSALGMAAPQPHHDPQPHHEMSCHGQCPEIDNGVPAPRLGDHDGEHSPAMPEGAMTCCIVTSSVTSPFAASSTKHGADEAEAESELPVPVVLPPENVTRHPRMTAGPPPIVMAGSCAGTRTYLATSRLRL